MSEHTVSLKAETAAQLMTAEPVTVLDVATIREASATMVEKRFSALPVVNVAGQLQGVVSQTDIVRALHEETDRVGPPSHDEDGGLELPTGETVHTGFLVEEDRSPPVRSVMTPKIFAVGPDSPSLDVVATMLQRDVHRVFVVDDEGKLVGVITAMDFLRHLWT